jgi:hypothetical protein
LRIDDAQRLHVSSNLVEIRRLQLKKFVNFVDYNFLTDTKSNSSSRLKAEAFLEVFVSQGFCLVRYADDFLILCQSEGRAHHALDSARRKLWELRLTLHPEKTRIIEFNNELKFLGYVFDSEGCYEQQQNENLKSLVRNAVCSGAEITLSKSRLVLEKGKKLPGIVAAKWRNRRSLKSPPEGNSQRPDD